MSSPNAIKNQCICEACGTKFVRIPSQRRSRTFCSRQCSDRSKKRIPLLDRFFRRIGKKTAAGCIPWTGWTLQGYGVFSTSNGNEKWRAPRFAYTLMYGPIPPGLHVLHKCDNPICVNPAHLFLGTNADNAADKVAKGRQTKGSDIVHSKLSEETVREIRRRYALGTTSQYKLAKEYGVTQSNVSRLVNVTRWKHI